MPDAFKKKKKKKNIVAWDQAPPFPYPQATAGLASLADIFLIWPRFLPFPPTVEPGPRLKKPKHQSIGHNKYRYF